MVARPRASLRRIAEMSFLLRAVLDEIAAAGGLKGKAHREVLDLVDAFVRGEAPAREAFEAARANVGKVVGRIGVGSAPLLLALSYVPIDLLMQMVEHGDDLSMHVLEHAAHAMVGGDAPKRVAALHAEAIKRAAAIDDTPIADARKRADGNAHDLDLPEIAIAYLASCKATRTGEHADGEATRAVVEACGHAAHPAILAFEAAYGGLEIFESDPHAPSLAAGPYAFFSALPKYSARDDDLVPVIVAWNDVYYALDAKGRGFTNAAMVEGVYRPSARDGRALLTQAILWRALETHPASFVSREGKHGAAMAKERKLARIHGSTGETERWWGDANGMRLVVEIDRGNGYAKPMTYATLTERRVV
jgi:hypothetical protein